MNVSRKTLTTLLLGDLTSIINFMKMKVEPQGVFPFLSMRIFLDQLPSPFILMGDFIGHHTLCGCEEVNNRGQQFKNLILKNDLILFNNKSRTYFHSASGTFTSIELTLSSPSQFIDFTWKGGSDPYGSDQFPIILENDGHHLLLKRFRDGCMHHSSPSFCQ